MPAAGKFLALTFLVSMMPSVSALQLDCGPGAEAKEKTQHTLTCEGLQADGTVYWTKYDRNLGKITVATCDATGSCQTNFSTRYDVKRPNNVTSTLKILEVKRDETFVEGEWSCVSRSNETASCYVTVVFLPHVGECTMGFSEQSGQVAGRCEMHKVYPSPTCNWYEELEGQETDIPSNQTTLSLTQYVDSSTSQIYFRGECMLHRPLPVTAGSYSYKVLIIPGLVEPLVDFTTTNRVAVPAPPVLRNCPEDYVTDADANSCTCATSDLGSPQGSLAWYDPNNSTVLRNTSLILALPFSRVTAEFSEQTYRCGVVHHTGTPSVDYVPKIAAPPNKPKLSGFDKSKVYKVGTTLSLQCSVDGGRPAITRVILQCADRPDEEDIHDGGRVISRLSLTLQDSHKSVECVCSATNGFLTSERVTLPISDILTSDSGKGDKLLLWQIITIAVGGLILVLAITAAVVVVKKRKSQKKLADPEVVHLTKEMQQPDTNSTGRPETPCIREDEQCGSAKNNGACGFTDPKQCSPTATKAREGKHKSPTNGIKNLDQLSHQPKTPHDNPYSPLPCSSQPEEPPYSSLDVIREEMKKNDLSPTTETTQKTESDQLKRMDDNTTKEKRLQAAPPSEIPTRPGDNPSKPQPPADPANSAHTQPAGQIDRRTGKEKELELTPQQSRDLSAENESPYNETPGDGESDKPEAQSRGEFIKSDGSLTPTAQGGKAPESSSQQQAGQKNSGEVTTPLAERSHDDRTDSFIVPPGNETGYCLTDENKELGATGEGGVCAYPETNDGSQRVSSATSTRELKHNPTSDDAISLDQLSQQTSTFDKHRNKPPECDQPEEHHARNDTIRHKEKKSDLLLTPEKAQEPDNGSHQLKRVDDDTTKEKRLQAGPPPEIPTRPGDNPSKSQPPADPASSAHTQPAGQIDRRTGKEKELELTTQQSRDLSAENESPDNETPGDGESDKPEAQSRGEFIKRDGALTPTAQGGKAPESSSQQQEGQKNSGEVMTPLAERSHDDRPNQSLLNQSAVDMKKKTENKGCASEKTDSSPQSNLLDSANSLSQHKADGSDGQKRDLQPSSDATNERKAESKGTEQDKTAGNVSSEQQEHQPINTETIIASHTNKSGDHGKIVANDERESSSSEGSRPDSNAGDETTSGNAATLVASRLPQQLGQTGNTSEASGKHKGADTVDRGKPVNSRIKSNAEGMTVVPVVKTVRPPRQASSADSTEKHHKANSSKENSAGNAEPEKSHCDPSTENKDGGLSEVPHDESTDR